MSGDEVFKRAQQQRDAIHAKVGMTIGGNMTLQEIIKMVEAAGYSWAVDGHPAEKSYFARVESGPAPDIADNLLGLGTVRGPTPEAALLKAFEDDQRETASRQR